MTDFPENLGVRARRAALLPGEQAEFERVLSTSPILRMAYQLGRDFDAIAAVETGDEQRVARFVDRALAARRPKRQRLFGHGVSKPQSFSGTSNFTTQLVAPSSDRIEVFRSIILLSAGLATCLLLVKESQQRQIESKLPKTQSL